MMEVQKEATDKVRDAILAMKTADPEYWQKTLLQRVDSPDAAGSICTGIYTPEQLEDTLVQAVWNTYPYPGLEIGYESFLTTDIHGTLGIVDIEGIDNGALLYPSDRKDTGFMSLEVAGVQGMKQYYTVLLAALEGTPSELRAVTFHPGPPKTPGKIATIPKLLGKPLTVSEALGLGFKFAKVVAEI